MIHRVLLLLSLCGLLSACAVPQAKFVEIRKADRSLWLIGDQNKVLKRYDVALGFDPIGHKVREGDGKTPEGLYKIDYHNPHSRYYKSLHISYPNATDYAVAREQGFKPGGDVMIHGRGNKTDRFRYYKDWTHGCIAVKDHEINQIYAMVPDGTPILIRP